MGRKEESSPTLPSTLSRHHETHTSLPTASGCPAPWLLLPPNLPQPGSQQLLPQVGAQGVWEGMGRVVAVPLPC